VEDGEEYEEYLSEVEVEVTDDESGEETIPV
jgi:hypothetical protein